MKSPIPKAPLAHNFGSASIIAHTIHQKFNLKVPNYRQEEDWARMGLPITRKEISNRHIKTSQYYLEPLYNLLRERLLTQPLLHADETSYRVLESDSQLTLKRRSSTQYYIYQLLRKMIRLYGHQQLHNNSEILVYSDYGHVDLLLLETNKIPVY
ncbi:transposase [Streptococcus pneumoniae]|nr:transposase [Streptococcus pneumoniae]